MGEILYSKKVDLRHSEYDIKLLFRELSIDDPKKGFCIDRASKGNIQKLFQANWECIKSNKFDFSTMERSILIWIVLGLLRKLLFFHHYRIYA